MKSFEATGRWFQLQGLGPTKPGKRSGPQEAEFKFRDGLAGICIKANTQGLLRDSS